MNSTAAQARRDPTHLLAQTAADERHTLLQSALLHLSPGVIIALVYGLFASFFRPNGLPSMMAILPAALIALIPIQLGALLWMGKQATGTYTLSGVVQYTQKAPAGQVALLVAGSLFCAVIATGMLSMVENGLRASVFGWLPQTYMLVEDMTVYAKTVLVINAALQILIVGIAAPVVEELYFRGYLLPRIAWMGRFAPLFSAFFFSLYHFWSPWNLLSRFLSVLPMTAAVYQKKDLRIGIITHCLLNTVSSLALLTAALQS